MTLKPYARCKGRKFKREKLKKLKKPISCKKHSLICNCVFSEKNKIRFVTQLFRWFRKDSKHYKVNYFLKEKDHISNCDLIYLSVKIQKAGWKKLLLKLNYHLKEYKHLKRRSYTLNFTFFFTNIEDNISKETTVDIISKTFDDFHVFVTTGSFFIDEFYNIINTLNKQKMKKKDKNDLILEDLDHVFSWNRSNIVISYDAYMPWYLTKENYIMRKEYKRKHERKYFCVIKEKKFKTIFPLKKVLGHIIVTQKDENDEYIYWKTFFKNQTFKKKEDLFKELKLLIKIINRRYKIDSTIVYFFLEILK